eukprot:2168215-Ditylum_brightwellii.AAC.1
MTEKNLFQLLDFNPSKEEERQKLDATAIIKKVQQNPSSAEQKYNFLDCFDDKRRRHPLFPLHQAILLRAPMNVIGALSCSAALVEKCDDETVLHALSCPGTALEETSKGGTCEYYGTALHLAIKNRPYDASWDAVMFLLEKHPEASMEKDKEAKTPLHLLLEEGAPLDIVSFLLKSCPGAIKEKDRIDDTPLHTACKSSFLRSHFCHAQSLGIISLLLKSWPDATKEKNYFQQTPLTVACRNAATLDVLSLLLKSWPDAIREKDYNEHTPLFAACEVAAPLDIISFLLESWSDAIKEKNRFHETPLTVACEGGASLDVIYLLLKRWPGAIKEKNSLNETPLHTSCQ